MNQIPQIPIIDGHNDVLLRLCFPKTKVARRFFETNDEGAIDLPRAKAGGLAAGFFAMYTPDQIYLEDPHAKPHIYRDGEHYEVEMSEPLELTYAQKITFRMFKEAYSLEQKSSGEIQIVRSSRDLQQSLANNVVGMILHIEGADCIDTNFNILHILYQAGLRSLGLVWSRPNAFGFGVPFKYPSGPDTGPGLTDAGKELVRTCNELGIMLDVSHLNEAGFWDVEKISHYPLVATHSAVNAIAPTARNLTDKQIDAIGASGGVIGINFHTVDVRTDGKKNPDTPLSQMVKHFDYVAERIGTDHLAFGSDFDGATMPQDLSDVSKLPNLIHTLATSGYDLDTLENIGNRNWLRILDQTWKG